MENVERIEWLILNESYRLFEDFVNRPDISRMFKSTIPNMSPEIIFYVDALKLMWAIAKADGEVTEKEIEIMNYVTGKFLPKNEIASIVEDGCRKLRETPFYKIPTTIITLHSFIRFIQSHPDSHEAGEIIHKFSEIIKQIIHFYMDLGKCIAKSDGYISKVEEEEMINILKEIKAYIEMDDLELNFNN